MIVALAVGAGQARAGTPKKSIWGPPTAQMFSQHYCPLGVGIFQYAIRWGAIAPTQPANPTDPNDPAYKWPAQIDEAIAAGKTCGIQVALMLIGTAPWANGGADFSVPPISDQTFADFARAAATRYPDINYWMVWGEPNRREQWSLSRPLTKVRAKKKQAQAPRRYASLLDTAYGALKSVNAANVVIGGMTFTGGAHAFAPIPWIRNMRLPNGRPPRLDMYGHNPFTTRKPKLKRDQIKAASLDFSDLDVLFKEVKRRFKGRPKIFISEFTIPTDFQSTFLDFHTNQRTQAKWLKAALKIVRRDKRIFTLGWYELFDLPASHPLGPIGWGLLTTGGAPKPAYSVFGAG
ncbi:MAG: hypothetical protein ACRDL6_02805 [Solirubrobacterales bacterium]